MTIITDHEVKKTIEQITVEEWEKVYKQQVSAQLILKQVAGLLKELSETLDKLSREV